MNTGSSSQKLVGRRHDRPGDFFMAALGRKGLIAAPGVYCAMGARQVREKELEAGNTCSYDAVYGSGWAIADMLWAVPDMGFHDRTMMEMIGRFIVSAAHPLPVILDAETGFGTEVTLPWTVELYDRMGVAVAHLEDQAGTRRCGNLSGKRISELDVMQAKIRSWLKTTYELGSSMRLMVRTDALTAMDGGIDVAIDRMKHYLDVNYQGLRPALSWADAMMKPEHIKKWCTEMDKYDPTIARGLNYSPNKDWTAYYRNEHGRRPPTYEELYNSGDGFQVQWHTILQARADMEATWNSFRNMARNGARELWELHERQRSHPTGDPQAMSNFPAWQKYELDIGGDEAAERYAKSKGYGK
jgi:2-methylisocitrate lyase-like PEP mutase family enzyme